MRAVRFDGFGNPEVLYFAEVDNPHPGPGDVLLRTVASAINPVDEKTRSGSIGDATRQPPMTLGWEVSGIIIQSRCVDFNPGDRVVGLVNQLNTGSGTWAELVTIPADDAAKVPAHVDPVEAACLPLPGTTAWQTLEWLGTRPGQRILITGAVGAVGSIAMQLAAHRGLQVEALVSNEGQVDLAEDLGATRVYTDLESIPNRSFDLIFDTFGAPAAEKVVDNGSYASIATQAGPVPDISARGARSRLCQVTPDGGVLRELIALVEQGLVRTRLDSRFPVTEILAAHRRFSEGKLNGKIALTF